MDVNIYPCKVPENHRTQPILFIYCTLSFKYFKGVNSGCCLVQILEGTRLEALARGCYLPIFTASPQSTSVFWELGFPWRPLLCAGLSSSCLVLCLCLLLCIPSPAALALHPAPWGTMLAVSAWPPDSVLLFADHSRLLSSYFIIWFLHSWWESLSLPIFWK